MLTLKDFLKVFNYDAFAKKACEVIKDEFRTNLTAMLNKQKTVELNIRE